MKSLIFTVAVIVVLFFAWKAIKLLFLPLVIVLMLYLIFKK